MSKALEKSGTMVSSWFPFLISLDASSMYPKSWVSQDQDAAVDRGFHSSRVGHDVAGEDLFHQLTGYAGETDKAII